jgi:hypothetical protein
MNIKLILLASFLAISSTFLHAQTCGYIAPTGAAPQPTSCNGTPTASITGFNGMSLTFTVVSGNTYTFTTCGGASWDTQLALWNLGGTVQYAFNDDDCGLQSTVTWTATFSGDIVLTLYEYFCNTDGTFTGATIDISCTAPGGPPAPDPAVCGAPTSVSAGPTPVCGGATASITNASNGDGYVISVVAGQSYTFTTCGGATWDTQLELWDIGLTGSYAYNDDDCGLQSTINWTATFTGDVVLTLYEFSCNTDGTFTGATIDVSCNGGPPPCASNPPPSDACINAPMITNFEGYCGTTSGYTVQSPGNLGTAFCGSIENNAFLSFIAADATITLDYWVIGGTACPSGAQFQIFEAPTPCNAAGGTWTAFTPCVNPSGAIGSSGAMTVTGLTVGNTYYLMIDGFAGDVCDYVFGAASGLLLPVEYYHFEGNRQNEVNALNWVTSEEMDAAYFEIERSDDGTEFEYIGRVVAIGESQENQHYNFEDESPINGINYYRLKQVDVDGQANYSDVIAINNISALDPNDILIAPNPTNGITELRFANPERDKFHLELYDITGRMVAEQHLQIEEGLQKLPINLSELNDGVYIAKIRLENSGIGLTKKIVKR